MHLKLVSVGKVKDDGLRAIVEDYFKRLRRHHEVAWIEVKKEGGSRSAEEITSREGQRILKLVASTAHLILLDEGGQLVDSRRFAGRLQTWMDSGIREAVFVIGGPYGHGREIRTRADWTWSLSPLTYTHQLVPAILAEQLYRADTILRGEPYHND